MPGLLRGIARTAAVAGTATAVSNRVSRRQGQRWAANEQQQQQQGSPPTTPPPTAPAPRAPAPTAPAAAAAPAAAGAAAAAAPAAAGAAGVDRIGALKELAELRTQGVLTEAEFNAEKAKILAS